jgi:peptide/nickel transport system permease protein
MPARTVTHSKPVALAVKTRRRHLAQALLRNQTALAGLLVVLGWVAVALTVSWWAPYGPLQQDVMNRLRPPSSRHLFGTDQLGRDVLSRVMYGTQISLPMVAIVAGGATIIGGSIGAIVGIMGGRIDDLIMRLADITLAFPSIVLAMAIVTATGPGLSNIVLAMLITGWPQYARLMRGQVLSIKQREHVEAARALGASDARVLARHLIPHCVSPVVVAASLDLGNVLLLAAGLSFIGLGAIPPQPEWGAMVAEGRTKFLQWWMSGFPGLAITSMVLGFNFIGDGLRDALDPRFRTSKLAGSS